MHKQRAFQLFDTVVLSNFALTGHLECLVTRYGHNLLLTQEVLGEVSEGVVAGYTALRDIESAADSGRIGLAQMQLPVDGRRIFRELLRILGPGEASCIAHASVCDGGVVSDDRMARLCCQERDIPVTGTIGILKACCLDGTLVPDQADQWLQEMVGFGYYAPVRSISGIL